MCPDPHTAEVDKLTRQINELQQTCKQMKAVMETPRIEDTEAIAALTIDRDYWKEIALRYNRDLKP